MKKELTNSQLNILTAERVMGWKRMRYPPVTPLCAGEFRVHQWKDGTMQVECLERRRAREWRPTDNAAQALQVFEKCVARLGLAVFFRGSVWCVRPLAFWYKENGVGETFELALCRFAVKLFAKEPTKP